MRCAELVGEIEVRFPVGHHYNIETGCQPRLAAYPMCTEEDGDCNAKLTTHPTHPTLILSNYKFQNVRSCVSIIHAFCRAVFN